MLESGQTSRMWHRFCRPAAVLLLSVLTGSRSRCRSGAVEACILQAHHCCDGSCVQKFMISQGAPMSSAAGYGDVHSINKDTSKAAGLQLMARSLCHG